MSEETYDESPERRQLPIERDELARLQGAGAQIAGRPSAARHLLARMMATLERHEEERSRLRAELAIAAADRSGAGSASAALAALAGMGTEEREKILGAHLSREAARLEEAYQDSEMEAVAGRSLIARLIASSERMTAKDPGASATLSELLRGAGIALK